MSNDDNANDDSLQNVCVVIRSSGERTESMCRQICAQECCGAEIHVIHEAPFSAALRKNFEIGISSGKEWTLAIDADVLCVPSGIRALFEKAFRSPSETFLVQCKVLDKFFDIPRFAGIRVYRGALLPKALECLTELGDSMRPETFVYKAMMKRGYRCEFYDDLIAIHDYEQYYHDVFRKGYLHAQKHRKYRKLLMRMWEVKALEGDFDFLIATYGFRAGRKGRISNLDIHEFPESILGLLMFEGLNEKKDISEFENLKDTVKETIDNYQMDKYANAIRMEMENERDSKEKTQFYDKLRQSLKKRTLKTIKRIIAHFEDC